MDAKTQAECQDLLKKLLVWKSDFSDVQNRLIGLEGDFTRIGLSAWKEEFKMLHKQLGGLQDVFLKIYNGVDAKLDGG